MCQRPWPWGPASVIPLLITSFISKGCTPSQTLSGSFQGLGSGPGNAFTGSLVFVKLAKICISITIIEGYCFFSPLFFVTFPLSLGGIGITAGILGIQLRETWVGVAFSTGKWDIFMWGAVYLYNISWMWLLVTSVCHYIYWGRHGFQEFSFCPRCWLTWCEAAWMCPMAFRTGRMWEMVENQDLKCTEPVCGSESVGSSFHLTAHMWNLLKIYPQPTAILKIHVTAVKKLK